MRILAYTIAGDHRSLITHHPYLMTKKSWNLTPMMKSNWRELPARRSLGWKRRLARPVCTRARRLPSQDGVEYLAKPEHRDMVAALARHLSRVYDLPHLLLR